MAGSPGGTMGMRAPIASRPSGWPVLRTPKWMLAAGVVLVAGLTLAAIPHRPSPAQRAADLRGMVHDLNTDIEDRKSTRLNSSHPSISYAVFCLKKKKNKN